MRNLAIRSLKKCESLLESLRKRIDSKHYHRSINIELPNSPKQWENVYLTGIPKVSAVNDIVARKIIELTDGGDVILEAGCGSGELSAQISLTGRNIILADFSDKILQRAEMLFSQSSLSRPKLVNCDLTKLLPFESDAVDVVWSSGVLEHWTDEELVPIVTEMKRISRKRVISLVPYSGSLFYRLGKHLLEKSGRWPYGREIPRHSLAKVFMQAGCNDVFEEVIWTNWPPRFLSMYEPKIGNEVLSWWESLPEDDPVKYKQGYLLLTVGNTAK